jgi:hypothetical protein
LTELQATTTTQAEQQPPPSILLLRQTNPVLYAFKYLNSPETQRQYPKRLKLFFDYIEMPGKDIEKQGQAFLEKATGNKQWAEEKIFLFLDFHKQRVLRKELAAGTLKNLCLAIKTFYEAYGDLLPHPKLEKNIKSTTPSKEFV